MKYNARLQIEDTNTNQRCRELAEPNKICKPEKKEKKIRGVLLGFCPKIQTTKGSKSGFEMTHGHVSTS